MTDHDQDRAGGRGPGAMMADVLARVSRLVQGEVALARAETLERVSSATHGIIYGVVAVVFGITAVNVLAAAAVAAVVALDVHPMWASIIVAAVLIVLTVAFALFAASQLRDAAKLQKRTVASVKQDLGTLQTMVKGTPNGRHD